MNYLKPEEFQFESQLVALGPAYEDHQRGRLIRFILP